jgi:hypothetical protein
MANTPLINIDTILYYLAIGNNVNMAAEAFDVTFNPPGGTGVAYNLIIQKPGQYFFDSFFVPTLLPFELSITNNDVLVSFNYQSNITVEIEDL